MALLRRIPKPILTKLERIKRDGIMVAASIKLSSGDVLDESLSKLGVEIKEDALIVPVGDMLPSQEIGPVSRDNVNSKEIIHKDKPKIKREIYLGERPIYGDWSNGEFSLWATRKVYQRSFIPPRNFTVNIIKYESEEAETSWGLLIKVNPILFRSSQSFEEDLLFELSLVREIAGRVDIFSSEESPEAVFSTRRISWEIFPPGERDLKTELARRLSRATIEKRELMLARASKIEALEPVQYILGAGLASNYYGALFADDLVLFENLEYGNATYILYDDWEQVSKLSRTEIINTQTNYDRVTHDKNWDKAVSEIIKHETMRRKKHRARLTR